MEYYVNPVIPQDDEGFRLWAKAELEKVSETFINLDLSSGGGGSGEANDGVNLGTGEGIFSSKVGVDLRFKSLVEGDNITLSSTGTEVTINAADALPLSGGVLTGNLTLGSSSDDPSPELRWLNSSSAGGYKAYTDDFVTVFNILYIEPEDTSSGTSSVTMRASNAGTVYDFQYSSAGELILPSNGIVNQNKAATTKEYVDGISVPAGGTAGQVLEKVDATDNNVQWATPAGGGGASVYGFMKRSSTDNIAIGTTRIIPWQTAAGSLGTDVTWSSGNNTRLTINTTGTYRVGGFVTFSTTQQRGQASVEILINGVSEGVYRGGSYVRNSGSSWDYWCIEVAPEPFNLTAGAYVEFRIARNSGANATYGTGGSGTIVHDGIRSKIWVERAA